MSCYCYWLFAVVYGTCLSDSFMVLIIRSLLEKKGKPAVDSAFDVFVNKMAGSVKCHKDGCEVPKNSSKGRPLITNAYQYFSQLHHKIPVLQLTVLVEDTDIACNF